MNLSKNILITGNGGVGKSSLIDLLNNKKFSKKYIPTTEIKSTEIKSNNGSNYTFYEYPGQWQYSPINMDLSNIDLHIIMYDLTNKTSFEKVKFWKEKVEKHNISVLIVGNKIDSKYRKIIDNSSINISVKNKVNIDKLLEFIDYILQ
mgnify:CR=1 FL=1